MPMTTSKQLAKDKRTASERPQLEHRHFAVIAAIIKRMPQWNNANDQRRAAAHHFARELRASNKVFNEQRFIAACGLDAYDD